MLVHTLDGRAFLLLPQRPDDHSGVGVHSRHQSARGQGCFSPQLGQDRCGCDASGLFCLLRILRGLWKDLQQVNTHDFYCNLILWEKRALVFSI